MVMVAPWSTRANVQRSTPNVQLRMLSRAGVEMQSDIVRCFTKDDHITIMKSKLTMEQATQLAVFLSNRPGTLARVSDALAKAGVNIHALTISDTVDHSVVRMVVSDPTKALMLLGEAGVLALENDVVLIDAVNEPGILSEIAERLRKAGVNIEYLYIAAAPKAERGLMVLRPSDVDKAMKALSDL